MESSTSSVGTGAAGASATPGSASGSGSNAASTSGAGLSAGSSSAGASSSSNSGTVGADTGTGESVFRGADLKAGDPIPGSRSALQRAHAEGRKYGVAADENEDGSTKTAPADTLPSTTSSAPTRASSPVGTAGTIAR